MASCFNWKEELPIVRPLLERSDMIEAQQRKKNEVEVGVMVEVRRK
jgi:hypothetical protein